MPRKPIVDPWLKSQRVRVGNRIRSLRVERDLTQERLAERAGISRDSVIYAENGTKAVSIDILHLLGRALGVPVTWLFVDDWSTSPGGGSGGGEPSE